MKSEDESVMSEPNTKPDGDKAGQSQRPANGFRIHGEPVEPAGVDDESAHKFDTGAPADQQAGGSGSAGLPASYGEDRVYLVAKDPHWLFSYWDIDWPRHAGLIRDSKVALRLLFEDGSEVERIEINPYARNWYLPAPAQGRSFTAELGYHDDQRGWVAICRSGRADVPATQVQREAPEQFARVPMHIAFDELVDAIKSGMAEGESLVGALARLQRSGRLDGGAHASEWSPQQRAILEALLGREIVERIALGSGTIDDALGREIEHRLSSQPSSELAAQLGGMVETAPSSLSSGFGASWSAQPFSERHERAFFMHVNAEVIFYGGTDPDARVWIDGSEVALEPDGTFTYHFKFPDGRFEVPIVARSPDGVEERTAKLVFQRDTGRVGIVGDSAQPDHLSQPFGAK